MFEYEKFLHNTFQRFYFQKWMQAGLEILVEHKVFRALMLYDLQFKRKYQ